MQIVVTLPDEDVRVLLDEVQYRVSPHGKGYYADSVRSVDGIIQQALQLAMPRFRRRAAVRQWATRKHVTGTAA